MNDFDKYALTNGQRFLATRIYSKDPNAKPLQRVYELCQDFDYTNFCEAVTRLVQRHPALRMKLIQDSGGLAQSFPNHIPTVRFEKVKGLFKVYREVYTRLLIAEEQKKPLDLTKESPLKIMIVKVNNIFVMSVCIDHLAVDEISYDLVEKELVDLYGEICRKTGCSENSTDGFIEYIEREQARRQCERENSIYWYHHLKEAPIQGPPPGKKKTSAGTCLYYKIHQPTLDGLVSFCQTARSSVSHLVTAIQLKLLAHAGKIDDVVIGIPISNRIYKKDEYVIGDLVMPVFVRFSQFQEKSLSELIVQVRDTCMESMTHRQYDYVSVMSTLGEEYMQRNEYVSLNVSNNFIFEQYPIITPNVLFTRRLDNPIGGRHLVSPGSFNIDARQNKDTLSLDIKWDAERWKATALQAKDKVDQITEEATADYRRRHAEAFAKKIAL